MTPGAERIPHHPPLRPRPGQPRTRLHQRPQARRSAPAGRTRGRTFSSEMNETSTVTTRAPRRRAAGRAHRRSSVHDDDARILAQLDVELPRPDVDREDLAAPRWRQAVAEAAGGGANVGADPPRTSTLNASRACTSFFAPWLTYRRPPPDVDLRIGGRKRATLSTRRPSTSRRRRGSSGGLFP